MERFLTDADALGLRVEKQVLLSGYTTLRLGGMADLFVHASDGVSLKNCLQLCKAHDLPVTILGQGSNVLILDGGIRGVTVHMEKGEGEAVVEGSRVTAFAGMPLPQLARAMMAKGLAGLEKLAGIPGTLGGAVLMNAGAYGGEMSQVVDSVRVVSTEGEERTLCREELDFSYRHSALQSGSWIVTEVTLSLQRGDPGKIRAEMDELMQKRREKQPLEYPSAGSTFRRPENDYAARLIDVCGLRGRRVGGAEVSEKHAGFLLNRGGTSRDFLDLMSLVQTEVMEKTGIRLEPEIRILGEN